MIVEVSPSKSGVSDSADFGRSCLSLHQPILQLLCHLAFSYTHFHPIYLSNHRQQVLQVRVISLLLISSLGSAGMLQMIADWALFGEEFFV